MPAPFRIRQRPPSQAAPARQEPPPPSSAKDWMERVLKLIPSEVVAVYLAGKGNLPGTWQGGWSYVCLALVLLVRGWGTYEPDKGVQWIAVIVSAVSFVIWVYATSGHFFGVPEIPSGAASAAVLVWAVVVPMIYKGD